jgi:hypothetical protein
MQNGAKVVPGLNMTVMKMSWHVQSMVNEGKPEI